MSDSEHTPQAELVRRAEFTATSWTAIFVAREKGSPGAVAALEKLCCRYWYPVYAHVRRRGSDPEAAADLAQEFFYRILRDDFLQAADRTKGKFRSFLLASLDHFLSGQRAHANAQKRGGGQTIISLDAQTAEERYALEPPSTVTPDVLFTRRWFVTLHEQVLAQLRAEADAKGKAAQFDRLKGFLTGDTGFGDYNAVAEEMELSPTAVAVAVHRLRARCRELWREEIRRTVATADEVDGEIRHLLTTLAG